MSISLRHLKASLVDAESVWAASDTWETNSSDVQNVNSSVKNTEP
jgi:hypothetical protein